MLRAFKSDWMFEILKVLMVSKVTETRGNV